MTPPDFHDEMTALLNDWCDRRALEPLRLVLPHYPIFNGHTDELAELARALKTVRTEMRPTLPLEEFDRIVAVLHALEDALERHKRNV